MVKLANYQIHKALSCLLNLEEFSGHNYWSVSDNNKFI